MMPEWRPCREGRRRRWRRATRPPNRPRFRSRRGRWSGSSCFSSPCRWTWSNSTDAIFKATFREDHIEHRFGGAWGGGLLVVGGREGGANFVDAAGHRARQAGAVGLGGAGAGGIAQCAQEPDDGAILHLDRGPQSVQFGDLEDDEGRALDQDKGDRPGGAGG